MFYSIRSKLFAITILSISVCACLVFLFSVNEHRALYRKAVEQNLEAISSNMGDDLLQIMSLENDEFLITTKLLSFDRFKHIKFATVFNYRWEIVSQYVHPSYLESANFSPELTSIHPSELPLSISITDAGLTGVTRIGDPQETVGYLLVVQDYNQPLYESRNIFFGNVFPYVLVTLLLANLAVWVMYFRLLAPLSQLAIFTRKVERTHDYDLRVEWSGRDEVSRVGHGINSMLGAIQTQIRTNNVQHQKLLEQQNSITYMAKYDLLTGLPNRSHFMNLLREELVARRESNTDLAIIFFDVDGLKGVNDTFGHDAGDQLLIGVAKVVESCLSGRDILGRLGGDEFLIMIRDFCDRETAVTVAKNMINKMRTDLKIGDWEVRSGISIGIAMASDAGFDITKIIANADVAMYLSKENGKSTYTEFRDDMLEQVHRRVKIARAIDQAITRDEFFLQYQLKISASGEVNGAEALLRWNSAEFGFVPPDEFIPIAEQSGKIEIITIWVVEQVFKDLSKLKDILGGGGVVSLNVSSYDLRNQNLITQIKRLVEQYGVDIGMLQFEITESSYLQNFDRANEFFTEIHNLGGSIALDDFGTGYSSLSYLTRIQIDTIKIDRMFISSLANSTRDSAILQTILELARRLGLKTCSEGVEINAEVKYLRDFGCDQMQGYLFARPLVLDELPKAKVLAEKIYREIE